MSGNSGPLFPVLLRMQTLHSHLGMSQRVESRMGAVAWAIRQRSVSHPRSSNRTCRSPASGSPTGFTVRHTEKKAASVFCAVRFSPSPYDTAFYEGSGSSQVFSGSSPITFTSPSSKAHQKSGPFPPPALPGFNGRMTLSDSRRGRRRSATLRPLPSHRTGLPRLPASPFRRAVPTTPADRAGARVDCFPAHTAFPKWQEGRHPHCHFRGLLRLHACYGPSDCSAAQGDLCHEAPALPVARPSRSSATRSIDNSLDGIFLHR